MDLASRLVCAGCGYEVSPSEPLPFRCPRTLPGDNIDHLLRRHLDADALLGPAGARALFLDPEPNPFLRFRRLLHSYQAARLGGWQDAGYVRLVEGLDAAVAGVDGRGFRQTPFRSHRRLARRLGVERLRIKNETGNVADTHKGRHLMGLMLWLRVTESLHPGLSAAAAPLAIASCGNAALAAAVIAKAAGRPLSLFVPPETEPEVLERFEELGVQPTICRRGEGGGDPAYRRLRRAIGHGALPFTVQGPDNGLVIEGGSTLAWEMAATLAAEDDRLDRLLIQVGGGALASATIQGLREARDLGVLPALPRIHAVQTLASPLLRAYNRLADEIVAGWRCESGEAGPKQEGSAARAEWIRDRVPTAFVTGALRRAAAQRSLYMRPWEGPLASIASSILDDETYDWLAVVEGMLDTGGWPLALPDATLEEAARLALEATEQRITPSGVAGFAAALTLADHGLLPPTERVAVLFTAAQR